MHDIGCVCMVVPSHMLKEIVKNGDPGLRLWAMDTLATSERLRARREVMAHIPVDTPSIAGTKRRTIFDAKGAEKLPGELVRGEGGQVLADVAANEAYDGAGAVYDMYKDVFKRNSLDDQGLRLDSTVHYGRNYDNAFWDGRQMAYGDGDGKLFNRFTAAIDVIGHEFSHGVIQHEAALVYWDQSGALNEHMADVFGTLLKQRLLHQTVKSADWVVGSGLFTSHVRGVGLRSMRDPGSAYDDPIIGKDPQPGHMKNFRKTNDDNGGVHVNSGIPNRAFYLVCEQLNDQWRPGQIWYAALCNRLKSRSVFRDCAVLTAAVAAEMFGANGKEHTAVKKAWAAVGIGSAGAKTTMRKSCK